MHSVFGQQPAKLKTLKQISVKFHTIRYLKCQNVLYVTGFIIVFVPVCRIFSQKLSEIEYDINLNIELLENVRHSVTQMCVKS